MLGPEWPRQSGQCILCATRSFLRRTPLATPGRVTTRPLGLQVRRVPNKYKTGSRDWPKDTGFEGTNFEYERSGSQVPQRAPLNRRTESIGLVHGPPFKILKPSKSNSQQSFLKDAFISLERELRKSGVAEDLEVPDFWEILERFRKDAAAAITASRPSEKLPLNLPDDFQSQFRELFHRSDTYSLETALRLIFYSRITATKFTEAEIEHQKALADFRYPMEWFPHARIIPRTIHMHVGPTNSGKTHSALKRLEEAGSGAYLSPLRLLAHEIYTRMNARGRPCRMITGEEQRLPTIPVDPNMDSIYSCTVEMAPLNVPLDVVVIDEIQMIGDKNRGHAWTTAMLGVQATEVHLCGEERAVPLVKEIARSLGEEVIVHEYQRLSPLKVMDAPVEKYRDLRKGDCVVAFSVPEIYGIRKKVEHATGKKVAVVYGALPPETRAQQAKLFNDPDNDYDVLVASDAVGMGLNLSIKRMIFDGVQKYNAGNLSVLSVSQVKQIAGRAGRYRTSHEEIQAKNTSDGQLQNVGLVSARHALDLKYIQNAMQASNEPLTAAALFPPSHIVHRFYQYFPPRTPYSFILSRLMQLGNTSPIYFHSAYGDISALADGIHSVKGLSIADRMTICFAPVAARNEGMRALLKEMATCVAEQQGGGVLELKGLKLEVLDEEIQPTRSYLFKLETLHRGLVLYSWMSFRFPGVFVERGMAAHARELVEAAIDTCLSMIGSQRAEQQLERKKQREEAVLKALTEGLLKSQDDKPCAEASHVSVLGRQIGEGEGDEEFPEIAEDLEEAEAMKEKDTPTMPA